MTFGDLVRLDAARNGRPAPNTDPETGVRFGVAGPEEAPDWVWDVAEPVYAYGCGHCGMGCDADAVPEDGVCPECGMVSDPYDGWCSEYPVAWEIREGDIDAEADAEGMHWIITRSRHIVRCRECSPCYPCAGDIGSPDPDGVPTYGWPDQSRDPILYWPGEPIAIRIRAAAERLIDIRADIASALLGDVIRGVYAPGDALRLRICEDAEDAMRRGE